MLHTKSFWDAECTTCHAPKGITYSDRAYTYFAFSREAEMWLEVFHPHYGARVIEKTGYQVECDGCGYLLDDFGEYSWHVGLDGLMEAAGDDWGENGDRSQQWCPECWSSIVEYGDS